MQSIIAKRQELYNYFETIKKSNKEEECLTGFNILTKLLENISNNKTEPQYRIIKTSNKAISTKLMNLIGIKELLIKIGFELNNENYCFNKNDFDNLEISLGILNQYKDELGGKVYVIEQARKIEKNEQVMKERQKIEKQFSEKKKQREDIERLIEEDKMVRKERYGDKIKAKK